MSGRGRVSVDSLWPNSDAGSRSADGRTSLSWLFEDLHERELDEIVGCKNGIAVDGNWSGDCMKSGGRHECGLEIGSICSGGSMDLGDNGEGEKESVDECS